MTDSPYDMLDPTNVHGLALKRRLGVALAPADIVPVLEANPAMIADADTRALVLAILNGETGPRRGRPPYGPGHYARLFGAELLIEDRAAEISAERAHRPAGARRSARGLSNLSRPRRSW